MYHPYSFTFKPPQAFSPSAERTHMESLFETEEVGIGYRGTKKKEIMPVVFLDGSDVRNFVRDEQAFNAAMEARFKEMDGDGDGFLSRNEIRKAFEQIRLLESQLGMPVHQTSEQLAALYDCIFAKFDVDRSGSVSQEEFKEQMREILLAIADGLGASPLSIATDDDGFLIDAVKHQNLLSHVRMLPKL